MHHQEAVRLHRGERKQQLILWDRQETVLIHAEPSGGPGFPTKAPRRHMRLEGGLAGRDQLVKFVEGQAGHTEELRRAGLRVGELYMCHA